MSPHRPAKLAWRLRARLSPCPVCTRYGVTTCVVPLPGTLRYFTACPRCDGRGYGRPSGKGRAM